MTFGEVTDSKDSSIDSLLSYHQSIEGTTMMSDHPHLVVPGQIIATSATHTGGGGAGEDSFLRGHGTYIERADADGTTIHLRAAVTGTVQRVNKLITVEAIALSTYMPQVGDLIVGRIVDINNARWTVDINCGIAAQLPLSGVHLPGSIQRIRTATDALEMRQFMEPGDLVSCEVHKVMNNTQNIMLHTRSVRYGKLENGCVVGVPPKLIPRRKTHYTTIIDNRFQILLGCNGMIWIQRNNNNNNNSTAITAGSNMTADDVAVTTTSASSITLGAQPQELAEAEEQRRLVHAETPYSRTDRQSLARIRNAIICLRMTLTEITPEHVESVYQASCELLPTTTTTSYPPTVHPHSDISDMLLAENVVKLTASCRQS